MDDVGNGRRRDSKSLRTLPCNFLHPSETIECFLPSLKRDRDEDVGYLCHAVVSMLMDSPFASPNSRSNKLQKISHDSRFSTPLPLLSLLPPDNFHSQSFSALRSFVPGWGKVEHGTEAGINTHWQQEKWDREHTTERKQKRPFSIPLASAEFLQLPCLLISLFLFLSAFPSPCVTFGSLWRCNLIFPLSSSLPSFFIPPYGQQWSAHLLLIKGWSGKQTERRASDPILVPSPVFSLHTHFQTWGREIPFE